MKPVDIIILVLLSIWFILSVAAIVKAKKKGGSCCHCSKECRAACKECEKNKCKSDV